MDALALLTADHNRVRGLFARFRETDEPTTKQELFAQIATELEVHTAIEEEVFYPWVRDLSGEIASDVAEGLEEHHVVDQLIAEAKEIEFGETWIAKVTVLIENVEHHAEEEEQEMFPAVRKASSAEQREKLGARLEESKRAKGAPVLADKIDLTTAELRDKASEQQIPGRSSMSHDELAATVAP